MHVGLVGTFDVNNFGDCMFPELYEWVLRERFPSIKVSLFSPSSRAADILSYSELASLPQTLDEVRRLSCDAFILVGGETLGFGHSSGTFNFPRWTLSSYLRLWAAPLYAALTSNYPISFVAHCIGARKMPPEVNLVVASALSGASYCSFRDSFSRNWLSGGESIFDQATDPMFLMDQLLSTKEWRRRADYQLKGQVRAGEYLIAHISFGYGRNDLVSWTQAVARIAEKQGLTVVLLPICHFLEDEFYLRIAEKRLRRLGIRTFLVKGRINVKDTAAIVAGSAGYVGSSLHGAVAAIAFGLPLAVLGHSMDGKHEGTLNSVGIFGCTTTDPLELFDCFSKSLMSDRTEIRDRAQRQAKADLDHVFSALNMPSSASISAKNAIEILVNWEKSGTHQIQRVSEVKRFILRIIRKNQQVYSMYQRVRLRSRILRSTSAG